MNKTVTINISGIIFHIEEDAYDKLSKYLNTIKGYFASNESGNEIITDIEARIAELLQAKVNQVKQVVLMSDVNDVIAALGSPEEFGIDEENTSNKNNTENNNANEPIRKRIFRDPDEKAIGGVCSGLAHYFDVDVVWIRLATFLLIFFGGISLWVYIILWIIIPEAKTTADRLAMRGEKINIDNISKSFKEEMSGVKSRMEKYGNEVNESFRNANGSARTGVDKLAYIIGRIFMVMARLIGAFLIFIAVMVLFGLMASLFGFSFSGNSAEYSDWINIIFLEKSHYWFGFTGLLITIGVPAFMLLYGGIKLLFKIKYSNRWLNISAGIIWFLGFIMLVFASVKTASDFDEQGKMKEHMEFNSTSEFITISANPSSVWFKQNNVEELIEEDEDHRRRFDNHYFFAKVNNTKKLIGTPELKIITSASENFEVVINRKARGGNKRSAYERAKEISYSFKADSSGINLDEMFFINENEKFRVQELEIIVKVPEGKTIFLDKSLHNIIYDVANVTDTYDLDMLNRKWKMTSKGLECIDCNGLERNVHSVENKEKHIIIDEEGVRINKKGKKIIINEDGVHVKEHKENHEE